MVTAAIAVTSKLVASSTTVLAEKSGPNPIIPHTVEIVVGLIAFGLLYFMLAKFAVPMFEKTFAERTAAIEGGLAKAEAAQAESARLLTQYTDQLTAAREEAGKIRAEAQADRARIVGEARSEAAAAAAAVTERAQAQMAAERASAILSLRREVGEVSVALAGKVVGESLSQDARVQATVERFLADLDSGALTSTSGAELGSGS